MESVVSKTLNTKQKTMDNKRKFSRKKVATILSVLGAVTFIASIIIIFAINEINELFNIIPTISFICFAIIVSMVIYKGSKKQIKGVLVVFFPGLIISSITLYIMIAMSVFDMTIGYILNKPVWAYVITINLILIGISFIVRNTRIYLKEKNSLVKEKKNNRSERKDSFINNINNSAAAF